MTWTQVVDISRYQGPCDMHVLRASGVDGLIIRATHGTTIDPMMRPYHQAALDAGFTDRDIGMYSFCNPKRTTGPAGANFFIDAVHAELGHLDTFLMLDIESYANETPMAGTTVPAAHYATWLRQFVDTCTAGAPEARVIGYTNDAYWAGGVNSPLTEDDDWLITNLDWIVARYPVYSAKGYQQYPLPGPDGWADWAFARAAGPIPPKGGTWAGWQFSAGYNGQGKRYGFASADLDLNIVRSEAWARWTQPVPIVPPEIVQPKPPTLIPPSFTDGDDMPTNLHVTCPGKPELLISIDGAGITLLGLSSPSDATQIVTATKANECPVSEAQYAQIVAVAQHGDGA